MLLLSAGGAGEHPRAGDPPLTPNMAGAAVGGPARVGGDGGAAGACGPRDPTAGTRRGSPRTSESERNTPHDSDGKRSKSTAPSPYGGHAPNKRGTLSEGWVGCEIFDRVLGFFFRIKSVTVRDGNVTVPCGWCVQAGGGVRGVLAVALNALPKPP
eukprot:6630408-Pyramimonas_sp.AAC.2